MRPLSRPFARTFIAIFVVVATVQGLYILTRREAVLAFKPTDRTRKTDFDKTHAQMVTESFAELIEGENIIPGVNKINKSMENAIWQIKWGDVLVDGWEYSDPAAHFTNDTFISGQLRLLRKYQNMKGSCAKTNWNTRELS